MTNIVKANQVLDSREVAEMIEFRHADLIEKIKTYAKYLANGKIRSLEFFIESTYKDEQGKERPCYLITKKGCELIANKITGQKGILFTARYVEKFNDMEQGRVQEKLPQKVGEINVWSFQGRPCITISDAAKALDLSTAGIRYSLMNSGFGNIHKVLRLGDMANFKKENPAYAKNLPISANMIIFEYGYKYLLEHYQINDAPAVFGDNNRCFTKTPKDYVPAVIPPNKVPVATPNATLLSAKRLLADTPKNPQIQEQMAVVNRMMAVTQELLRQYNRPNEEHKHNAYDETLRTFVPELAVEIIKLLRIKPNIVETYI